MEVIVSHEGGDSRKRLGSCLCQVDWATSPSSTFSYSDFGHDDGSLVGMGLFVPIH